MAAKGTGEPFMDNGVPIYKDAIKGGGPGSAFGSIDHAAMDFGMRYNGTSIKENREYATIFYSYKVQGVKVYSYTNPVQGGETGVSVPRFSHYFSQEGWGHTHGAPGGDCGGQWCNAEAFSPADLSITRGTYRFVATPNGVLYRNDNVAGTLCITRNLPNYANYIYH
jgi:hypothetical protein